MTDKATDRGPQTIIECLRYEGWSDESIQTMIPGAFTERTEEILTMRHYPPRRNGWKEYCLLRGVAIFGMIAVMALIAALSQMTYGWN